MNGYDQFFFLHKVMALGIVKFLIFNHFLKFLNISITTCHTWYFGFNSRNGFHEAHLIMRICTIFFLAPKVLALGKSKFWFCDCFFLKVLTFLENFPPKSKILGSIEITVAWTLWITVRHIFFRQKVLILGIVKFLICWPFFGLFSLTILPSLII